MPGRSGASIKSPANEARATRVFLESCFQKLLMNFTWWVNRKDSEGRNLFAGGFLGLDNIGVFDRSKMLGDGNSLEQADGTALDGLVLPHHARDRPGVGAGRRRLRGHRLEILRALRLYLQGDQHVFRHGPLGRGGTAFITTASPWTTGPMSRSRSARSSA